MFGEQHFLGSRDVIRWFEVITSSVFNQIERSFLCLLTRPNQVAYPPLPSSILKPKWFSFKLQLIPGIYLLSKSILQHSLRNSTPSIYSSQLPISSQTPIIHTPHRTHPPKFIFSAILGCPPAPSLPLLSPPPPLPPPALPLLITSSMNPFCASLIPPTTARNAV